MLLIIFGIPLILTFWTGIGLSILAVWLFGRKKPWFGEDSLVCFLGICFYAFLWILLIGSIHVGPVGSNTLEGYPALLLKAFMLGLTPVTALPALMAYGPEKKWLTFDPMWIKYWRIILMEILQEFRLAYLWPMDQLASHHWAASACLINATFSITWIPIS